LKNNLLRTEPTTVYNLKFLSTKRTNNMSADSLYDSLRGYLRVSARVTEKQGNDINVGERFTVRVTGANNAGAANLVGYPRIVFRDASVYVQGTEYARPVDGNAWHNLPDNLLFPGESSSVNIEFEALRDIPGFFADLFSEEKVANIWIKADLDQNRYFELWNKIEFHTEIEPT